MKPGAAFRLLVAGAVLLVAGCHQEYAVTHIARCEVAFYAMPTDERVASWGIDDQNFIRTCMSAANFEFKSLQPNCKVAAALDDACYFSRDTLNYRFRRWFR